MSDGVLQRVCVFCGSSMGTRPEYGDAARAIGRELAERGMGLVYGGGDIGLMGEVANAALAAGTEVIGVIPRALAKKEVAHWNLTELRIVDTMHERKAAMYDLADAFVALPGGIGTVEELFEVLTGGQLGMHAKPVGLVNTAGYWDALLTLVDRAVDERFLKAEHREMLLVGDEVPAMFDALAAYSAPAVTKWIDREVV